MTIRKRLFLSNILMIAVPAFIAAFAGCLCLVLVWVTLHSGGSMRLEDGEDLTRVGRAAADRIRGYLADNPAQWQEQMGRLEFLTASG